MRPIKTQPRFHYLKGCVAIRVDYRAILHLSVDNLFAKIEAVLNRFIFGFVSVVANKFPNALSLSPCPAQ
jgi:hypothetical protein